MFTAEQEQAYRAAIARFWQGNKVIGAGFLIEEGYLLTCAHVVEQALRWSEDTLPIGELVIIDFPFIAKGQKQRAEVLNCRVHGEDAACLRLQQPSPAGAGAMTLRYGQAWGDRFAVCGFPKGYAKGSWAKGEFSGENIDRWIQMEAFKAQGYSIEPGYSGAPVWSEELRAVVGIAVAHDRKNEEAKVGFMVPARSLSSIAQAVERLSLLDILESAAITPPLQGEAYKLCCLEARNHEPVPDTLDGKLSQLQDMNDGGMDYPVYQQFIAYFLRPELNLPDDLVRRLRSWLSPRIDDVDALLALVNQRYETRMAAKTQLASSHLLIWVYEGDRLQVKQAIYIPDYEKYSPDWGGGCHLLKSPEMFDQVDMTTLPKLVRACIDEASNHSPPGELTIELLLPMSQLGEAIDIWDTEDANDASSILLSERLGSRHRIVVRSAERLEDFYKKFLKTWEVKWQMVEDCAEKPACNGFYLGDDESPLGLLAPLRKSHIIGLKLTRSPERFDKTGPLAAVLTAAIPAAIWLRPGGNDIAALDALLGCCVEALIDEIKQTRLNALENSDSHIGHHLSFLWEDPKLVPPSTNQPLMMT